jgi:galactose mutarotase-like enzyme
METIRLQSEDTVVEVVPERGALVTRCAVGSRELLWLDPATVEDRGRSVRGGIPVLFPFAGALPDDRFFASPTLITTMRQHGFGRDLAWTVTEQGSVELTMALGSSDATRTVYPYEFLFLYRVRALPRGVLVELAVHNQGDAPVPVAPGLHPYFACPVGRKGEVGSDLPGFDAARFVEQGFDFGLPRPGDAPVRFRVPDLGQVELTLSPAFRFLQFWTLPGKPFVCLEPFFGAPGTINDPERRDEVPPGGVRSYDARFELLP